MDTEPISCLLEAQLARESSRASSAQATAAQLRDAVRELTFAYPVPVCLCAKTPRLLFRLRHQAPWAISCTCGLYATGPTLFKCLEAWRNGPRLDWKAANLAEH